MTLKNLNQYGPHFQIKVLSSLLTHKEFLVNIQDILSDEYFDNQAHKWIIKEVLRYYDKYHTTPSMDILKVEVQKIDNEVLQLSVKEQLREAYQASDEDLEYVQEEFTGFCKNQQIKKALMSSVDLLKAGDFDSIKSLITTALQAGNDKNVGHEYLKDLESRFREDARTTIPTPWTRINELLQGGLGNGDFGLIFGNPGGGKSWSLVAIGGYAVRMGYNVVHYTLELGEQYVGRRYDAFFSKIPVDKILKNRERIEEIMPSLEGELIIKEFPTGRATMSTIESHITKITDMGVKPDLVIIDYVDLLGTKKKTADRKGEIDDIYQSTKGLARQLDIPIWSVSQVNRAGAKDDIVEGDKAAGSYDKIMITDVCISLSRKKADKANGTGRFHIMKNRYGIDGLTFGVEADTSTGHFVLKDYNPDDYEKEPDQTQTQKSFGEVDSYDKKALANQFFTLNK
ncbi:MAG: DnaB-like helicase C-terminal domain-containing protein [Gammaproteobacteria bacterium]|jgi:replicative DNA helicase|tara:strand:- start:21 stop:1388 length:1368 start_codon:yes stop_codon:yes gene_type:complete